MTNFGYGWKKNVLNNRNLDYTKYAEDWQKPLDLIGKWSILYAGEYLCLRMVNFHAVEIREKLWKDWEIRV